MFKFVVPIVAMLVANMPASIPDVLYDAKLSEAETVENRVMYNDRESVTLLKGDIERPCLRG